jgi:hypothetical protein
MGDMTDPRLAAVLADYLPRVLTPKPSRFRCVSGLLMAVYMLIVTVVLYRAMDRIDVLETKVSSLRSATLKTIPTSSALPDVLIDPQPEAFGPVLKVMPRRRPPVPAIPRIDPADCRWLDLRQEGSAVL